jgi:hypothetical protein
VLVSLHFCNFRNYSEVKRVNSRLLAAASEKQTAPLSKIEIHRAFFANDFSRPAVANANIAAVEE